ncbi:hypothetical protein [Frigoribacterium sp. CG_9.8]|uniref:hypothetical protein n=1 Tax=Frigoribacterium sp. CG_9.8 TaxID=2787733 RepID=UPI0018C99B7B|nr:hypothetical protein [Frigoribacterium sp. CG_9.8]MBG6106628.1 hypothetical protein [Frigoribacterium sp. CG_9.8]
MLIAEPRVIRLLQFVIYVTLLSASGSVIFAAPDKLEDVLGHSLVAILGAFIGFGSLLGALAVLPGIWWLERAGIIAIFTGLAMYVAVTVTLGTSLLGISFTICFMLTFVQRFLEIRKFQLAPKLA